MLAALPVAQPVGAAAHDLLVEGNVAEFFDIGLGNDGQLGELREQDRIGCFGVQRDLRGTGDVGGHDLVELGELRALEGRVDHAAHAEGHILGGEFAAVLEDDVGAQVEHQGERIGVAPGGRDLRDDLAGDVPGDEVVEDVAVDRGTFGVPLHMGIHGGDVGGEIHRQGVLLGPGRGGQGQTEESHCKFAH